MGNSGVSMSTELAEAFSGLLPSLTSSGQCFLLDVDP